MREHEIEPVPGLPEELPAGERILWQGSPSGGAVGIQVLHMRAIAIYFAILLAWFGASQVSDGAPVGAAALSVGSALPFPFAALALLGLFAYLVARTTLYTITSRRIVMRFGIALPITLNVPFAEIEAAGLREYADATGDIPLTLSSKERQSFVVLWPHVRPWRLKTPEPMLRCVPDARSVAQILAQAAANAREGVLAVNGTIRPAQPGHFMKPAAATAAA